jgi:hypothetical protein
MDPLEAALDRVKPESVVLPCGCDTSCPRSTDCQNCACYLDHVMASLQKAAVSGPSGLAGILA